jgi:hypothetical protein
LLTVTLAVPDWLVNPEIVSDPGDVYVVVRSVPFSDATDPAINPAPVMLVEKTPSGICAPAPTAVIVGVGAARAIEALADPPGPLTVTVSALFVGNASGAV